jgi:hypothetical protein
MSGCKNALTAFIKAIDKSAAAKVLKGAPNGAGGRLFPSATPKNDTLKGFRIDQGGYYDDDSYDIVVQPNAQSTSPGVIDFIKKHGTHSKLATMKIKKKENDGEGPSADEIRAALLEDFQRREAENKFT